MTRIYNPIRAVASIPFTVRINHVSVSNNDVYELYYDTFDLFMNSQTPAILADTSRACNAFSSDFAQNGNQGGDLAWIKFFPRKKDATAGDYFYVIKLPVDFTPAHTESIDPNLCSSSYHR